MNKHNTLFGQMLDAVGRPRFDSLVKSHESDKYCNGNATWMQFAAMLYAQITDANGLRSIEEAFRRNSSAAYHLGLDREIKRSSISYANNTRDCSVFYDLFTELVHGLTSGGNRKMRRSLFAVDATTISLNKNDYSWADFRETKAGIKIHVQYKADDECPTYFFITNAREHENNTMEDMDLKKGDRVAMDRGYFNASEFHRMSCAGIEFVTRTKSCVQYEVVRELPVTCEYIEADRIIKLTGDRTSRKCPDELRLIRSADPETGKSIEILTNMKKHSAKFIAGLYKKRWKVELFFKAVKQNLHIKKFFGKSENAVFTQVYIAMIAYVLFLLIRKKSEMAGLRFTHFIDMIKVNLFTRTDLFLWMQGKIPEPPLSDFEKFQALLPFV